MTVSIAQLERDLEDTQEDLRRAKRELDLKERAPYDGRMTNREGWERSRAQLEKKVYRLQGEARLLQALLENAEGASTDPTNASGNLTNGEGQSA